MPPSMHPSEVLHAPPTREFLRIPGQSASAYDWEPESRREGLRAFEPSEFRKFTTQNRLSPLLPPFELPFISPTPPPAYVREEAERSSVLHPQGSMPSLSCVSTRATPESFSNSSGVSEWNSSPKSLTYATKSSKKTAQSGSHTAPAVEAIRARVVTAMQEVERLQKKIDDVVERQSLYTPSRPSSAHSSHPFTRTLIDLELMPSIPALPPSAPSFAERLHGEDGLSTGPADLSTRSNNDGLGTKCAGSQRQACQAPLACDKATKVMPTPLPLVLRPPLRKKKPFSGRFSGFVFSEPPGESSLDCVTKIKDIDGFYRCVPDNGAHHSYESLRSMSTSNCGDNSETGSQPSLYYTPSPHELPTPVERCATFGQEAKELPFSVGIAL
ncbi:hypothetical protein BBO_06378 [Beauveria brongniartii RCEF 3172]|uniref:Uncharacterized protein n=1 Tax=Beauveria brongniartii RCEF 3172 TaxID=1081107 RepID=A0A167BBF9_9HYPO|nr:hypothetical protein BBO_06378 [Beauveria brongniartii RCEF 3172]